MKKYFQMIQDGTDVISECKRDTSYNIMNFGNAEALSSEKQGAIRKLVEVMPFSYIAIRISRESLQREQEQLDVDIGLGILKKNKELLHIEFPKEIKPDPECRT
jgi:hypothetical protein